MARTWEWLPDDGQWKADPCQQPGRLGFEVTADQADNLECSFMRWLSQTTQLSCALIPDPQKLQQNNCCHFKSLRLGVVCYAAIKNEHSRVLLTSSSRISAPWGCLVYCAWSRAQNKAWRMIVARVYWMSKSGGPRLPTGHVSSDETNIWVDGRFNETWGGLGREKACLGWLIFDSQAFRSLLWTWKMLNE